MDKTREELTKIRAARVKRLHEEQALKEDKKTKKTKSLEELN